MNAKQKGELAMLFIVPPSDAAIPSGDEGDFSNERILGVNLADFVKLA